jgi:hypothetical protein
MSDSIVPPPVSVSKRHKMSSKEQMKNPQTSKASTTTITTIAPTIATKSTASSIKSLTRNEIKNADKYCIDGWHNLRITPSLDSSTNNSSFKSYDSELMGVLRIGSDKYDISSALYSKMNDSTSSLDTNSNSSMLDHRRNLQDPQQQQEECYKQSQQQLQPRSEQSIRSEVVTNDNKKRSILLKQKGFRSINQNDKSPPTSSSVSSKASKSSRSSSLSPPYFTANDSSSSSTSATLNSGSNCSHVSMSTRGTSSFATSRESSTALTTRTININTPSIVDIDDDDDDDDDEAEDLIDPQASSMSYSDTTFSTLDEDGFQSFLFSDRIASLFGETKDDDDEAGDGNSVTSSDICSSENCVNALVDLPWIFDDLDEECRDDCHSMNLHLNTLTTTSPNTDPMSPIRAKIIKDNKFEFPPPFQLMIKDEVFLPDDSIPNQSNRQERKNKNQVYWLVPEASINRSKNDNASKKGRTTKNKSAVTEDISSKPDSQEEIGKIDSAPIRKDDIPSTQDVAGTDSSLKPGMPLPNSMSNNSSSGQSGLQSIVLSEDRTPKMSNMAQPIGKPTTSSLKKTSKKFMLAKEEATEKENKESMVFKSILNGPTRQGEETNSEELLGKLISVRSTSPKNTSKCKMGGLKKNGSSSKEKSDINECSEKNGVEAREDKDIFMSGINHDKLEQHKNSEKGIAAIQCAITTISESSSSIMTSVEPSPTTIIVDSTEPSVTFIDAEDGRKHDLKILHHTTHNDDMTEDQTVEVSVIPRSSESHPCISSSIKFENSQINVQDENLLQEVERPCHQNAELNPSRIKKKCQEDGRDKSADINPAAPTAEENSSVCNSFFNMFPSLCNDQPSTDDSKSAKSVDEVTIKEITPISDISMEMSYDGMDIPTRFLPSTFLMTSIYERNWKDALAHLAAFPTEARIWVSVENHTKSDETTEDEFAVSSPLKTIIMLPLHGACYYGAPLALVQNLINAYPEAVRQKVAHNSKLPVHIACEEDADPKVVLYLIHSWPTSIYIYDGDGNIPLTKVILSKPLSPRKKDILDILLAQATKVKLLQETGADV